MSRLDLVIFGATGFTGSKAVEMMTQLAKEYPDITWGVAGRSRSKLEKLVENVSKKTGAELSSVRVIVADVTDSGSLDALCQQTRVVANCCGPYRLYGERLVRAALRNGAHHLDISAEPQFIEKTHLLYDEEARAAGVYVICACGFDCVPSDMGVQFLENNFAGTINSVEMYLSGYLPWKYVPHALCSGCVHYGTWESFVHCISNWHELAPLREKLYSDHLESMKPKLEPRAILHRYAGGWCIPFPGADNFIVSQSQRRINSDRSRRPAQFRAYLRSGSLCLGLVFCAVLVLLYAMSRARFTRRLLLDYPRLFTLGVFSRHGPSDKVMDNTHFQFELNGVGWGAGADVTSAQPDRRIVTRVSGVNPGYGTTSRALLLSAITILTQRHNMPKQGGVYTTAVAFENTDFIKRLQGDHFKFEVVKVENIRK